MLWHKSFHPKYLSQQRRWILVKSFATKIVVTYSNVYAFRRVDISGIVNQYIMYALNAFYKDVDDLKKSSILWNVVNWSTDLKCVVMITHLFLIECLVTTQHLTMLVLMIGVGTNLIKKQQHVISSSVKII